MEKGLEIDFVELRIVESIVKEKKRKEKEGRKKNKREERERREKEGETRRRTPCKPMKTGFLFDIDSSIVNFANTNLYDR